ncbi:MAG: hypothetical protein Kow00127_00340 [Bacteroidales bacterium]
MRRTILFIWTFFICFLVTVSGQEYLSGLIENPVLRDNQGATPQFKSSFYRPQAVWLPFFDDFSESGPYPDTARWTDRNGFVNSTFPLLPPDLGVVTLDVLNAKGKVYPGATPWPFSADQLTSRPIRLDSVFDPDLQQIRKLVPADSIMLSFWYQPQGYGDYPLWYDSLLLEFGHFNMDTVFTGFDSVTVYGYDYLDQPGKFLPPKSFVLPPLPCDSIWTQLNDTLYYNDSVRIPCDSLFGPGVYWVPVWSAHGDSLQVFLDNNDRFFKLVEIPITDTTHLKNDFQFRFRNFGSISDINSWQSNTDQWHIDRVRLDFNRHSGDESVPELRFAREPGNFINDFRVMPYRHYSGDITGYKKDTFDLYVHNLDSVNHTFRYRYAVQNEQGDTLPAFEFDEVSGTIIPLRQIDVFDYQPLMNPEVAYFYTSVSPDTADYYITHMIASSDEGVTGDTLRVHQMFRNYFAYDDGTAEAGYGLSPAGAQLAVRFRSEEVDTVRGVDICFNRTLNNNNDRPFHLVVWNDNNGIPGDTLMVMKNVRPKFSDGLNRFSTYWFDRPVKIGVQSFHVGWIQTSNDNLNVGFDRNSNAREKNHYNVDGQWITSSFDGAIMIRPVVGAAPFQSKNSYKTTQELEIYPNPQTADGQLHISLPESTSDHIYYLRIRISNLYGAEVYEGAYRPVINTGFLHRGLYIVQLIDGAKGQIYSSKLLINR